MLGVLLLILKILGWLLLSVLGLLLFLVFLFLCLPIPYRVWMRGEPGETSVFSCRVKIFGFQVFPLKKEERQKKQSKKQKRFLQKEQAETGQQKTTCQQEAQEAAQDARTECVENFNEVRKDEPLEKACEQEKENENKKESKKEAKKESETAKSNETQAVKDSKAKAFKQKQQKHGREKKRAETTNKQAKKAQGKRLYQELTDAGNHRALAHALRELRYLLRHFGPRHVRADAVFSLGDPANTGYATAALGMCPFAYGTHCQITPDFAAEQVSFRGWIEVRGHVRIVHAVISGLRLLFDKDIRTIFKKIKR